MVEHGRSRVFQHADGTTKKYDFSNGRSSAPFDGNNIKVYLLTLRRKQNLLIRTSKRQKDSSRMLAGMVRKAKRSTKAPLVRAVPIWIVNRIVGAAIHQLAKVDVM